MTWGRWRENVQIPRNVINPDDVIEKYGADSLRIYEMFMGPLERDKPWSTTAIEGFTFYNARGAFADENGDALLPIQSPRRGLENYPQDHQESDARY